MIGGGRMNKYQDALENLAEKTYGYEEKSYAVLQELINQTQKQMSSRWIPVSERLPEKDGEYLCTTVYGNVTDIWIDTFYKGEWTRPADVEFDYEVLAWQPLPEPYKEEEKE